jgi:imidazole glycerol-phosphate synthase subunit HisF
VDAGDPAELAHRHAAAGADEIVLLDITATHEGRGTLLDTVKRTAAELFVPFTVGGGIRSAEDAVAVFDAGADKVSINSSAIARPELIGEIGGSFGAQAVIVAIDARRGPLGVEDAEVYVSGGRKATGRRVVDWAREAEERGAGEILLTSMNTDGMRSGFDCELTAMVSGAVQIPVIASGGAGSAAHFVDVFGRGRADAALAASIFHFGVTDSRELKGELQRAGVSVRLPCWDQQNFVAGAFTSLFRAWDCFISLFHCPLTIVSTSVDSSFCLYCRAVQSQWRSTGICMVGLFRGYSIKSWLL